MSQAQEVQLSLSVEIDDYDYTEDEFSEYFRPARLIVRALGERLVLFETKLTSHLEDPGDIATEVVHRLLKEME